MSNSQSDSQLPSSLPREFTTTHWSVVLVAGGTASSAADGALEHLCRTYWYPLYAYVRRHGHSESDAQDLTQSFFARLLERKHLRLADRNQGRFRTFLLSSLKNFLINEWKRGSREKRGGTRKIFSLDEETAEARFASEAFIEQPPDSVYDRGWAATLVAHSRDFSNGKVTLLPCVYGIQADDDTWRAVTEAVGPAVEFHGAWIARWRVRGCNDLLEFDDDLVRPRTFPANSKILLWQYSDDCHGGDGFDCDQTNPSIDLQQDLLSKCVLPPDADLLNI